MQILHINASYKPAYIYGGPTMSVSKLAEELIKSGIQTEVYTTTANGSTELDVVPGVKVLIDGVPVTYFKRLTKGNSHLSLALLISLWNDLVKTEASGKVDYYNQTRKNCPSQIVHIHAWWNFVSVGSCLVASLLSKTIILSPRGTLSNYSFNNRRSIVKNLFHRMMGKFLLKRCHIHVSSDKEKQDILNLVNPKTVSVIPNFVKFDDDQNERLLQVPLENNSFKFLFLSRIEEKKGLDIFFRALQKVQFKWNLTIAGSGTVNYISYLKGLALKLQINDKITWIGQQDHETKFNVMATHDLLVLTSHDESFANVIIESLSVGTAVLISKNVGLADYIEKTDLGWTYENDNDLISVLVLSYKQKAKRTKIRKEAPFLIRIDFNDEVLLKQYVSLYRQAISFPIGRKL